jgi:asparagine N-glycosylation enzyme membrane subunit Stt3
LKENSQPPLGDPGAYYELFEPPPWGENFTYPESAYGVMVWWDYGHLITRVSHRIPVSNPFQQGASSAARFFTAPDESTANHVMDKLGARYVVIDDKAISVMASFPSMAIWSGKESGEYFEVYNVPREVLDNWMIFYYPEYYRSLATRLYAFDGKAVIPKSTIVISYSESKTRDGTAYKIMTALEKFDTYEEAEAFVSSQTSGNYRIVGTDPYLSPVPLEALTHYKLSYSSVTSVPSTKVGATVGVKIFEYFK